MKNLWQRIRPEFGQGTVEFALIACFVVGLAAIIYNSNLSVGAQHVYENVSSYLSGVPVTTQASVQDGKTMSNTELRQISNNQRIAHDQEALANLSSIFLGKSQNEIKNMLNGPSFDAYDPSKGLSQATLLFDYDIKNTGDEDGLVQTSFRNAKASPDVLLQWMEGNYIQSDKKIKEKTYNERVFLSDDLIDPSGVLNGMEHEAGTYAASVRCAFTFDSDGKCDSVRTWVTRTKKQDGTNNWLRYECEGLTKIVVTK